MVIFGVTAKLPKPVFVLALKNFTAGGGGFPAGMVTGYEMVFVGSMQVLPPLHATVGIVRIEEVIFDPSFESEANFVDVMVRSQPAPEPVASATVSGSM